jgi:hypothetical protein
MNDFRHLSIYTALTLGLLLAACDVANPVDIQPPRDVSSQAPPTQIQPPPLPTTPARRLRVGELVLAADIDDIPAIFASEALFVDMDAADLEIQLQEPVIGLSLNGEARA